MSRVLQAVDSIHSVGLYCLALVPHNHLPKTPLGGIHLSETKKRFLEGTLHPVNVLMCPHTCVTNLPKPREIHTDVGPASVIVGNLVQVNTYRCWSCHCYCWQPCSGKYLQTLVLICCCWQPCLGKHIQMLILPVVLLATLFR